ncbi:hypothetical protein [Thermophilibacter sp.]
MSGANDSFEQAEGATETAQAASSPHRRGPKKHRFTKTQMVLLRYIAGETLLHGGVECSKRQLAEMTGRNVKTIDRCLLGLRREGVIEAQPRYGENGTQLASWYRTVSSVDQGAVTREE